MTGPLSGSPRWAWRAVSAVFFANGAVLATWAARIPDIRSRLGLDPGALGLALLAMAVGALIAMNISGYMAARIGSRPVTTVAGVCLCLTLPLLAVAPGYLALVGALALFGAANGALDVAMNAQGVAVEKRYGRPILSAFHAMFSVGGTVGAFVGALMAGRHVAPLAHFVGAALIAGALVFASGTPMLPAHADAAGSGLALARPSRAVLALGVVAFCVVLMEGAMSDWSAIYLRDTVRSGAGLAAVGYGAFSVAMATMRFSGDALTAHYGPRTLVRVSGGLGVLGMALALSGLWAPATIAGFTLVGLGCAVVFPITLSAAGRIGGASAATTLAMVATCGYLGFLAGPPLIGLLANALSLRVALMGLLVTGATIAWLAPAVGRASGGKQD